MGTIRFLLAFSVVFSHITLPHQFLNNGADSVQLFFIISGFYMFMILQEKYLKLNKPYWYFISNRILRLYPSYILVLIITIVYAIYSSKYSSHLPNDLAAYIAFWNQLDIKYLLILGISNISIIGQELLFFFNYGVGQDLNKIIFRPDGVNILSQFIFVPQAWSIGMELWFYLLAPFIFKISSRSLIMITSIIIISKILFLNYYSNHLNYQYHMLIFELALFLLGGISFKFKIVIDNEIFKKVVFVAVLFFILSLNYFVKFLVLKWVMYLLFSLSIPTIFSLTKSNTFDKLLGDLSYHIYISHILIISILREFEITNLIYVLSLLFITIVTSAILNYLTFPIEKFRINRLNKIKP